MGALTLCAQARAFSATVSILQTSASPQAISPNEDEINDETAIQSTIAVSDFTDVSPLVLVTKTSIKDPFGNTVKELRSRQIVSNNSQAVIIQIWDGRKRNHQPVANGRYSYQTTAHIKKVYSTIKSGEVIITDSLSIASKALVSILTPDYGSYIKGQLPIEIEYRNGVKTIELYIDDQLIQTKTVNPPYKKGSYIFTVNTQGYPDGEHTIQAFAYLTHEGVGSKKRFKYHYSPEISITIDNTAPVISSQVPAPESAISEPRPVISALIDDAVSEINPATLSMKLDTIPVNYTYSTDSGAMQYTPDEDLAGTSHTVEVSVQDIAGNQAAVAWSFTVNADQVLSVSVTPDAWNLGVQKPASITTMLGGEAITVLNNGTVPSTYSLCVVDPRGWVSSQSQAGNDTYVMNAAFSSNANAVVWNETAHALATSDTLCSDNKFSGDQTGVDVSAGESRTLWLQFKAPVSTQIATEQDIGIIVTAEAL